MDMLRTVLGYIKENHPDAGVLLNDDIRFSITVQCKKLPRI